MPLAGKVLAGDAESELVQVRFTQEHRAGSFETANNLRVLGRNAVLEQATGCGRAQANCVYYVFERDWNSVQGASPMAALNPPALE